MSKKRVVVTGLGVASCFGNDVDVFYNKLLAGESGVIKLDHLNLEDYPTQIGAAITDFDPSEYLDKKRARRIDRSMAYTIVAGHRCLEYGGLGTAEERADLDVTRCGIIIGSGMGGMETYAQGVKNLAEKGVRRMSPFFIPYVLTNMCGGMLAIDVGFMGPNYSVSSACATGNHAIIAAAEHIRKGDADIMLCGGVEATLIDTGLAGFCAMKAMSVRNDEPTKASRPWDKDRDGFVMGEGCGCLMLESLEHAQARGATIYAEYLGGGMSCDAFHITDLREDGLGVANCLRSALRDAEITADDVNLVNAHATSTPAGDMREIEALKQVFTKPGEVTINATKSMIGHGLGAAGGLEAVGLVKAIQTGKVHPTLNLDNPEEGMDFHAPTTAFDLDVKAAVSNSFGFGGHNAVVVFGKMK